MTAGARKVHAELADLAAEHSLGGFINAVDELAKRHGADALPPSVRMACTSLSLLVEDLNLARGTAERAADVWRSR